MQDATRDKILHAAEQLFADKGFANTSLRAITAQADVNLAAVNYHFGSKEALIQEIFQRRLGDLNRQRLELLNELQTRTETPSVEAILQAYLEPTLKVDADAGETRFMRLLGRTHLGASPSLREFLHALYDEVLDRFSTALSRALPQLGSDELYWRLHFLTGTLSYSLAMNDNQHLFNNDQRSSNSSNDSQTLLKRLIPFLAAGLNAPPSG